MSEGVGERRGACVAYSHICDHERGHGRQRARAQPLQQPRHAVVEGWFLLELEALQRRELRAKPAQERQVVGEEAIAEAGELLRLAQLLAALLAQLEAQRCGRLVVSLQLLLALLALLKATAKPGSSMLYSRQKVTHCSSPLSVDSAIASSSGARALVLSNTGRWSK